MIRIDDRFYLNKAEGKFLGVCAGIADYCGIEALWVRVGAVALTLLGSGITVPIYFIIAFLASRRPRYDAGAIDYAAMDDSAAIERLRRRRERSARMRADLGDMDRRLADMESRYRESTSRIAGEIDRLR